MTMKKSILIVEDHLVARMGLKVLLQDIYSGLHFFEAANGEDCLHILKHHRIELIVMDLQLPETDTIGLIELISIKYPGTYILVFSMLAESIYGQRVLKAGASGYLSKESSLEEIKKAFDLAFANKKYMSQQLVELLANQLMKKGATNPFEKLSHREFEIVHLLLKGKNITVIGQHLNIKPSTVGTYKSRIFDKMKVSSIFELNQLATLYGVNYLSSTLL